MGDDTWMNLYQDLLDPSMSFPYDSFNVEDLHSVDNGVVEHLFPLLKSSAGTWDFLIGHFLGVDHVGHRVGPSHPLMHKKLKQMDGVLRKVVNMMDDDTLLVLVGDHGMDTKGDHGGDSMLETASALWIYSKSQPLQTQPVTKKLERLTPNATFPNAPVPWRKVQQIDLVPSLSLLLGLPIPFNNLGSVIPELFLREDILGEAFRFNARQIKEYLDVYRGSASGGELDGHWESIQKAWEEMDSFRKFEAMTGDYALGAKINYSFARTALEICREMWAQFSMTLIVLGVTVIGTTIPVNALITQHLDWYGVDWNDKISKGLSISSLSAMVGATISWVLRTYAPNILDDAPSAIQLAIFGASLSGNLALLVQFRPTNWRSLATFSPAKIILLIQATLLFSNSFVFWEERVVSFFLVSSVLPFILPVLRGSDERLQKRALAYGGIFILLVRLISISTICREEQGGYCRVTFYASSVLPSPPFLVRTLVIAAAYLLPDVVRRFMRIATADHGFAPFVVEGYFRAALLGGMIFWYLDWLESTQRFTILTAVFGTSDSETLRTIRTVLAIVIAWASSAGLALWSASPLNLAIRQKKDSSGHVSVQVLGFANSFGSFYLSFLLFAFAAVWLGSQLSAQLVLALAFVAFLCYLEFIDSVRDLRYAGPTQIYKGPTFSEILPIGLLGLQVFYATGHEATLSSLQWKSAFIFTGERGITSPFTVILNTIGPTTFFALCTPLLAMWAVEPFNRVSGLGDQRRRVMGGTLKAIISTSNYYTVILMASAACAMILRRHLMVWKVFAPRFMLAGICSVAVDIAGILAMLGGVSTVVHRVSSTFQRVVQ